MASHMTDDFIQSTRLVRQRYVRVAKDQENLLKDAWHDELDRGPRPMQNVPPGVFQDVKDSYLRQISHSTAQASPSGSRPSTATSARPPPKCSQQERPSTPLRNDDAEDSDGTPIPGWSPSQPSDKGLAGKAVTWGDEVGGRGSRIHSPVQSPPISASKRKMSPRFINNEPQSSSANSEVLTIEPLGFVSQEIDAPVNRTASRVIATGLPDLKATPPSAQMAVGTAQGTARLPPAKRRRMEEVRTSDFDGSNKNSLNTSASSPSVGIQTTRDEPIQSDNRRAMFDAARQQMSSMPPTYEGRQSGIPAHSLVRTATDLCQRNNIAQDVTNRGLSSPQAPPRLQDAPTSPYAIFKAAYPDYSASNRHFITALLIVKDLKQRREIHEFLYDDFIRAYSNDFFVYISECSRKGKKQVLPGIQWYNEHVKDVLYTRKIIQKASLSDFLAASAAEAHSIRREIEESQSTASQSDEEESDEDMEGAVDEDEIGDQDDSEPEVMEPDQEDAGSRASSDCHVGSPIPLTMARHPRQVSPELRNESPGAAIATAKIGDRNASSRAPKSPTPVSCSASQEKEHSLRKPIPFMPFATQVIDNDFLKPIPASSSEASPLRDRSHVQRAPSISPPPLGVRKSSSNLPQQVLADEKEAVDKEAACEDAPVPPPQHDAGISSSKKPISVSSDDDGEPEFHAARPAPRQAARLSSMFGSQYLSLNEEGADPYDVPVSPTQTSVGPAAICMPKKDVKRVLNSTVVNDKTRLSVAVTQERPASTAEPTSFQALPSEARTPNSSAPPGKLTSSKAAAATAQTRIMSTRSAVPPAGAGRRQVVPLTKPDGSLSEASNCSASAATVPRRVSSTPSAEVSRKEQRKRSAKWQEFFQKRALAGTLNSTSTSKP